MPLFTISSYLLVHYLLSEENFQIFQITDAVLFLVIFKQPLAELTASCGGSLGRYQRRNRLNELY